VCDRVGFADVAFKNQYWFRVCHSMSLKIFEPDASFKQSPRSMYTLYLHTFSTLSPIESLSYKCPQPGFSWTIAHIHPTCIYVHTRCRTCAWVAHVDKAVDLHAHIPMIGIFDCLYKSRCLWNAHQIGSNGSNSSSKVSYTQVPSRMEGILTRIFFMELVEFCHLATIPELVGNKNYRKTTGKSVFFR